MKKIYLVLLMLVAVALSASAAKHSRLYSFAYDSNDHNTATSNREFQYTSYTYVSFLAGYQGRTGQTYKTETIVKGYDNRFAFYNNGRWHWRKNRNSADNYYLKNDVQYVSLFSVLNLRAGDIVRIKCNDANTSAAVQDRFITAHSPNSIDNRPWDNPSGTMDWLTQANHEFIMQEDGNLDLNCAADIELVSVEIVNPFEEYNYWRNDNNEGELSDPSHEFSSQLLNPDNAATFNHFKAEVGQEIVTQQVAPMDEDHHTDWDGPYWTPWQKPIVQFRGDIHPTDDFETWVTDGSWQGQKVLHVKGFDGKGGAVVIMYERYMFVYTIPYKVEDGSKAWNFWSNKLDVGYSTEDGSAGPESLSLQHHDNSVGVTGREQLNYVGGQPWITRYKDFMKSQNAFVNAETAGLMFWTRSLGNVNDTRNLRPYGYSNEYQKDKNGNYMEDGDGYRYLTILKGGGFTIPDLKAGDQVYIYMAHTSSATHGGVTKAGVKFKVWNALDALKKPISDGTNNEGYNYGTVFAGGSTWGPWISNAKWGRQYYGALHFYAAKDGDMHFLVDGTNDTEFVKLCYIRIYRNTQDIITQTDELLGNQGYEFLLRQNPEGVYFPGLETRTYNLRTTNAVSTNQHFTVLECSGNLTMADISSWGQTKNTDATTNPGYFEVKVTPRSDNKPISGAFLLRGEDFDHNNKYCVNYGERVIAVGTLQEMNYPYTWNFKDILGRGESGSLFTADATQQDDSPTATTHNPVVYGDSTRIWIANDGEYLMNNSAFDNGNRNWSSGAQLFAKGEFIEEAAGVGFATWNQAGSIGGGSRNGDIAITEDGVRILPPNAYGMTRVFVPYLKRGQKLFIQGKRYIGGVSGFGASYLSGKAVVDGKPALPRVNNPWNTNRYHDNDGVDEDNKWSENPLLADKVKNMNIILGNEDDEVEPDNFAYNFSGLDIQQPQADDENPVTDWNIYVDEHLTVLATEDNGVDVGTGSANTVSNSIFKYSRRSGNDYYALVDGVEKLVQYRDDYGNNILTEDAVANADGQLIYDSNDVTAVEDNDTYTGVLKLNGTGAASYRVAKISGLDPDKQYDITVVLKSQNSAVNRELKIYGGSWEGTELATMLARNRAMAKSITGVDGQDIFIGSADNGVEIFAIYVTESGSSSTLSAVPFIAYIDMDEKDDQGNYVVDFYGQESTNITMYLSDVLIEHMAVSMDEKKLNDIGWASESRQRYIDHSLNEVFNNKPVKAYVATGTSRDDDSDQSKLISYIKVSPLTAPMPLAEGNDDVDATSGTGCILYNDIPDADIADEEGRPDPMQRAATISLFVPAIHDYIKDASINQNSVGNTYINTFSDNSTLEASRADNVDVSKLGEMTGNMMLAWLTDGNLDATDVKDDYTYYVLSYKWKDPQGNSHPTAEEIAANNYVEKFVRSAAAHLKDNSAYIRLSTAAVNPNFYKAVDIVFDGEEGGLNGITDLTISGNNGAQQGKSDSYYTLSGQKINKPTMPGIYVKNGKKVFVK